VHLFNKAGNYSVLLDLICDFNKNIKSLRSLV